MRSMMEGAAAASIKHKKARSFDTSHRSAAAPSTTLRVVPLPSLRRGRVRVSCFISAPQIHFDDFRIGADGIERALGQDCALRAGRSP